MTLAVTGHRPHKLGGWNLGIHNALIAFATDRLQRDDPAGVITGMALGWDQAVAVACVRLGIPFVAAVPFEGQESRWNEQQQGDYQKLLLCASAVHVVVDRETLEAWSDMHSVKLAVLRAMQERNCWMVDNSTRLLALWNGEKGGTGNCVRYAKEGKRQIENVWPEWAEWMEALTLV